MIWYQCDECIYGSNSERNIINHVEETDHTYHEEDH